MDFHFRPLLTRSEGRRKKCEKINKRAATAGNVMGLCMMCKILVNVIQMWWDAGVKFPNSIVDSCIRRRHMYHFWRKTTTYQCFHSTNFSNGNQVDRNWALASWPTCEARVEIEFEFKYMTTTARSTAPQHMSLWNPFRYYSCRQVRIPNRRYVSFEFNWNSNVFEFLMTANWIASATPKIDMHTVESMKHERWLIVHTFDSIACDKWNAISVSLFVCSLQMAFLAYGTFQTALQ